MEDQAKDIEIKVRDADNRTIDPAQGLGWGVDADHYAGLGLEQDDALERVGRVAGEPRESQDLPIPLLAPLDVLHVERQVVIAKPLRASVMGTFLEQRSPQVELPLAPDPGRS